MNENTMICFDEKHETSKPYYKLFYPLGEKGPLCAYERGDISTLYVLKNGKWEEH